MIGGRVPFSLNVEIVLAHCAKGGVPSSLIYSIADIFEDT